MENVATLQSTARVEAYDSATGELSGQLMFGILVPSVPVIDCQRRGVINTTREHFCQTQWHLEEGDSMTVKVKDGRWLVTLKKAWEAD